MDREFTKTLWSKHRELAPPIDDDRHARLWRAHRDTILRDWWGMRTAGALDAVALVIDGAVTKSGATIAVVVSPRDAARLVEEIRPEVTSGLAPIDLLARHLTPSPLTRRLVVVSCTPDGALDVVVQDDLALTGRGGDA